MDTIRHFLLVVYHRDDGWLRRHLSGKESIKDDSRCDRLGWVHVNRDFRGVGCSLRHNRAFDTRHGNEDALSMALNYIQ